MCKSTWEQTAHGFAQNAKVRRMFAPLNNKQREGNVNVNVAGFNYDPNAEEWSHQCGACGTELYAPTRLDLLHNFQQHTKSDDCLGGY